MLIAKPWYESGSFWQFAITTLVAVAVGFLGAFATLRASNPKRRLAYWTLANTSLFVASHSQTGALTVAHHGTTVQRPRVVELELRNTGRRDITAAQFHAGQPIVYDLGADVVAVLEVASQPTGTVAPSVGISAGARHRIEVPPCLLARKQKVNISLLVDGPERPVRCLGAPLVDVQVRETAEPVRSRSVMLMYGWAINFVVLAIASLFMR
ncbi:hypothetical protein ABZ767_18445 [Streptomyces pseudogriseolus]|uniref:hypothetical protein n=1 Tax=Streptomyces pseudogriseolus TaxID=36817 RepID=UPI003490A0A5